MEAESFSCSISDCSFFVTSFPDPAGKGTPLLRTNVIIFGPRDNPR